jgi:alpha-L-rhamnosidase
VLTEIAYRVATQRTYPGWGYMVAEGATTLWERWEKLEGEGMNSHNHIMLGSIDAWFYRTIAGLVPLEPGWKKVRIKPHILGDLTDATATLQTVRGEIYVSWEKKQDLLRLLLSIPTNVSGEFYIPVSDETVTIREGGVIVWAEGKGAGQVNGVTPIEAVEDYVHMRVGSGYYEFEVYG